MNRAGFWKALGVFALLANVEVAAASAVGLKSERSTALTQLISAAPGGPEAFSAIKVCVPEASAAVLSNVTAVPPAQTSPADGLIRGLADSAERQGKKSTARLLQRLLAEGTAAEKAPLLDPSGKPYAFPERFYPAVYAAGKCHWVTEQFCKLACWGTGIERECREECRNIIVKSCDNL